MNAPFTLSRRIGGRGVGRNIPSFRKAVAGRRAKASDLLRRSDGIAPAFSLPPLACPGRRAPFSTPIASPGRCRRESGRPGKSSNCVSITGTLSERWLRRAAQRPNCRSIRGDRQSGGGAYNHHAETVVHLRPDIHVAGYVAPVPPFVGPKRLASIGGTWGRRAASTADGRIRLLPAGGGGGVSAWHR